MHRRVGNHDEGCRKDAETDNVFPQSAVVEAKSTQYRRTWHLDIKTILMIDQGEISDFVDNKTFEAIVKDGQLCRSQYRF